ncbi:MAG: DUF4366 domain-containing protein [Lachnospiraceae bacterium]|nr:DUF4366 domain-containing protein [Lachnospiraceae bacterium]
MRKQKGRGRKMSEQRIKKKRKWSMWNVKKKITVKVIMPLLLLAALFCTLLGGFLISGADLVFVKAQELDSPERNSEMGGVSEMDGTGETDGMGETVSGNTLPEPECICRDKCSQYDYNKDCAICKADYRRCGYVNPNVKITIKAPNGWYSSTTKVHISVEDVVKSGNFAVKSVQAKVSQNGSWIEITEDMYVEISENCTVYVRVTDQKDIVYEKSRYIRCFDFTAPSLNAAVSDGMLSVKAHDTDSGVKAIYVNGYEFTDIENGTLNVRLQQFDASYEYFSIYAMDNVGNMSEVYKTKNPYYQNQADADSNEKNPAGQLPVSAEATKPSSATAQVTEHTVTDGEGNTISEMSLAEQKKQAMAEAAALEKGESSGDSEKGKEFYTIQTASEKVFYLVIDRDGEEEVVYFLTEISENDLLNVTTDNSETLPKNSAALESAIPVSEGALPDGAENGYFENAESEADADMDAEAENGETTEDIEAESESQAATYIILGIVAVGVIGGAYYFKVVRKKEEGFLDEDDEEDDEEDYLEDSDEENDDATYDKEDADSGDDFFDEREEE